MSKLRMTALAILVAVCALALAPAAEAGTVAAAARGPALAGDDAGWVIGVWSWLTEWARSLGSGLRAVVGADGSCVGPNGAPAPCPPGDGPVRLQGDGDDGTCVDPNGAQAPCSS